MDRYRWYHLVRLAFVVLAASAVVVQLLIAVDHGRSVPNFLSFYTIQSNIIGLLVLAVSVRIGLFAMEPPSSWDMWRGAATAWMATTGIVFAALLSGLSDELQLTEPWVDTVLHQVMPVVMVADWLLAPPRRDLVFRKALVWMVYPLVFCAYSLIRGPIVDWYPYPFLDPREDGYLAVAGYSVGIAVLFVGLVWLVVWSGNRMREFQAARLAVNAQ